MSTKNPCGNQEHKISSADLLPCPSNDNEQKRKGGTMYKANLQRCRSVSLCISRPVSFIPQPFFSAILYTQYTLFELCGFHVSFGFSLSRKRTRRITYSLSLLVLKLMPPYVSLPSKNRTFLRTYLVLRQSVIFRLTAPTTCNSPTS